MTNQDWSAKAYTLRSGKVYHTDCYWMATKEMDSPVRRSPIETLHMHFPKGKQCEFCGLPKKASRTRRRP